MNQLGEPALIETRSLEDWKAAIKAARGTGDHLGAFDLAERALQQYPEDYDLEYAAMLALADGRAFRHARKRLRERKRMIEGLAAKRWAEFVALLGRLLKEHAARQPLSRRPKYYRQSAKIYEEAFSRVQNAFLAINAATMWRLAGDLEHSADLARQALCLIDDEDKYWSRATFAEALILLGDAAGASEALHEAQAAVNREWYKIASTRRQLRLLLPATPLPIELLDVLAPPGVLCILPVFFGPDADADDVRSPDGIAEEVDRVSRETQAAFAVATLLTPLDVVMVEALLARGIGLQLVLPCGAEQCRAAFVERYGAGWSDRFDACLARAEGSARKGQHIMTVTDDGHPEEQTLLTLCRKQMIGLALLRSDGLIGAPVYRVTPTQKGAGAMVLRSGPLDRAHIDKMVLGGAAAASIRVDRGLLFGDMSDFSKLNERQIAIFHDRVMGGFGKVLDRYGNVVEYTETAGDSIFGVLHDVSSVAECCVELQKAAEGGRIAAAGLPSFLMLRLSAHVGPVTPAFDHITKRNKFIGTEITRTARIEPKTPKGAVYVTEQFAATLYHDDDLRRFRCEYVGIRPMAKDYGECRMYSLQREDDSLQREEGA